MVTGGSAGSAGSGWRVLRTWNEATSFVARVVLIELFPIHWYYDIDTPSPESTRASRLGFPKCKTSMCGYLAGSRRWRCTVGRRKSGFSQFSQLFSVTFDIIIYDILIPDVIAKQIQLFQTFFMLFMKLNDSRFFFQGFVLLHGQTEWKISDKKMVRWLYGKGKFHLHSHLYYFVILLFFFLLLIHFASGKPDKLSLWQCIQSKQKARQVSSHSPFSLCLCRLVGLILSTIKTKFVMKKKEKKHFYQQKQYFSMLSRNFRTKTKN